MPPPPPPPPPSSTLIVVVAALYHENNDSYLPDSENFFVALACIGFFIGLYLNYYDYYYYGNVFNLPSSNVKGDGDYSPLADDDCDEISNPNTERGAASNAEGKSDKYRSAGDAMKPRSASEDAKRDSEGEIAVAYDNPILAGSK